MFYNRDWHAVSLTKFEQIKIARRLQHFGVRKVNRKATEKRVRLFRQDVIYVTVAVGAIHKKLRLTLLEHLQDRQAFETRFYFEYRAS